MSWPTRLQWNAEQARTMGRKGGQQAGAQAIARSEALWQRRFPGVPLEAIRAIYARGYNAGYGCASRRRVA